MISQSLPNFKTQFSQKGLVGWLVGFLTSSSTTRLYRRLPAATHETELGDYGFCLSRSHYISKEEVDSYDNIALNQRIINRGPGMGKKKITDTMKR